MKVAILSDIHDNVWHLQAVLRSIQDCGAMLCCGDLCSPFVVDLLCSGFAGKPIHIVFGNNDGDLFRITGKTTKYADLHLHGQFFEGQLDGKRIAMNHYPEIACPLSSTGMYDVVCYGHNHVFDIRPLDKALTINPGTVMGYDPIHQRDVVATFAIYDTQTHEAQGYRVPEPGEAELAKYPEL